jgi:hypothetical protein
MCSQRLICTPRSPSPKSSWLCPDDERDDGDQPDDAGHERGRVPPRALLEHRPRRECEADHRGEAEHIGQRPRRPGRRRRRAGHGRRHPQEGRSEQKQALEPTTVYGNAAIPVRAAWSSPFVRWQGALSELSSIDLAVDVTTRALAERAIAPSEFDSVVLGWTVPSPEIFYGAPTIAARIGAPHNGCDDLAGMRHVGRLRGGGGAARRS